MIRLIWRRWNCLDFAIDVAPNNPHTETGYVGGLRLGPVVIDIWNMRKYVAWTTKYEAQGRNTQGGV
jgi:hypothetical protein